MSIKRAWARRRRIVIARDGRRCTNCHRAGRMDVHHVVPGESLRQDFKRRSLAAVDDLASLCTDCHRAEHRSPIDPERLKWQRLVRRTA